MGLCKALARSYLSGNDAAKAAAIAVFSQKANAPTAASVKDFAMILWVVKAWAKGFTLSGNEQAHAADSRKSTQKINAYP